VVTIKAHHARGAEETVFDMPPVVSADTGNSIGAAGAQRMTGELASKAIPTHPDEWLMGTKSFD